VIAPLDAAEAGHGFAIGRVAGEVKAADALDGYDLSGDDQVGGLIDRVIAGLEGNLGGASILEPRARPADRAGVGFRVEPAI